MQDLGRGKPEVGGGWVGGGGLDCQLDVWVLFFGRRRGWVLDEGGGGRRGYGEAAGLGDGGDVDVKPLAGEVAEGRLLSMRGLVICSRRRFGGRLEELDMGRVGEIGCQPFKTVEACVNLGI